MFHYRLHDDRSPGTIQDLLLASEARMSDASGLLAPDPTASVYLAGYVVECLLKHAALRVCGSAVYDPVWPALRPMRARVQLWLGVIAHEAFHSLEFWALGLREAWRHERGEVPAVVSQATQRACALHQGWTVSMRYRSNLISEPDARDFHARAVWFRATGDALWRPQSCR
jgi:hypothetical protein